MNLNIHLVAILTTASITTNVAFFASLSSAVARKTVNPSAKSALIAAEPKECTEYKKRNGATGKQAADDAPSWGACDFLQRNLTSPDFSLVLLALISPSDFYS